MAYLLFSPMFWNPWMFLFPELYPAPRKPLQRGEPEDGK